MNKLLRVIFLFFVFSASMTGCGPSIENTTDLILPQSGTNTSRNDLIPDWDEAGKNKVGEIAYRRMDALGAYHFDTEGKTCCYAPENRGMWVQTDEKSFGEEYPNHHDIWCYPDTKYAPGEPMRLNLTFRIENKDKNICEDILGSVYFADLNGSDGSIGSNITVCNYFDFDISEDSKPKTEMSFLGKDNDGFDGFAEGSNADPRYLSGTHDLCRRFLLFTGFDIQLSGASGH